MSPTAAVGDIIGKIDGALGYLTGSNSFHESISLSVENENMCKTKTKFSDVQPERLTNTSEKKSQNQETIVNTNAKENTTHINAQNTSRTALKETQTLATLATEVTEDMTHQSNKSNATETETGISIDELNASTNFNKICNERLEEYGLPLKIFTGGNLCQPYVSLSYLDTLTQPSVHGYMIGATNDLFLHRKGLADVIIRKIDGDYRIDIQEPELKKALQLSTEDLRFTENLVQHACDVPDHLKSDEPDVFLDGIGWEGGDEWVRAQFRFYIVCLLRTVINRENPSQSNQFNATFIDMWKKTKNYRAWRRFRRQTLSARDVTDGNDTLQQIIPGHPYAGTSKLTHDISLHVKNAMQNTESGKRVSKAVASTGQAVSKGLSSAKSTFSSFSSLFSSNRQNDSANSINTLENATNTSPKTTKSTRAPMQKEINETNGDYVTASE